MTTLYTAYIVEDYEDKRKDLYNDPAHWERRLKREGPFTIDFIHTELVDSDPARHRLLLRQKDGTCKWFGPWAPHSMMAYNEEDAVQMLRWNNMDLNSNPECWNGPKGIDEYHELKAMLDRRAATAEKWLSNRKITLLKPFWQGGPGRKVWA